ncbi:hypothetical protein [Demequina sp.]|uniref:hypothetical protein n=1 Tax=Demequina sp. TaxID=2050685 RepID=UPI0025C13733|nr:hypothetical protein [Demequina sp.]
MLQRVRAAIVGGMAFLLGLGAMFVWDTFGPEGTLFGSGGQDGPGELLLAIDADGSALYAVYPHTGDPYRADPYPEGERPGIVVETQQGTRTTLLEAQETPGVAWTVTGDLDGTAAVKLRATGASASETHYFAGSVAGPLAEVPSPTVDGDRLDTVDHQLHVAGDRLVAATASGDALALIDTASGESQLVATDIGRVAWVHRDLCAPPDARAFTIGALDEGAGTQWVVSLPAGEAPTMTQVSYPASMGLGAPTTSCGASYAAVVSSSADAGREATLFQGGEVWAIGEPGQALVGEVLLGPDYVLVGSWEGEQTAGGTSLVRRSDRSWVWIEDAHCGPWRMRGEWIAYVKDTGGSCEAVVKRASDVG